LRSIADDIIALQVAIAAGAQTVSYGDKRVEYRSLAEMRQILAGLIGELTGRVPTRQFRVVSPADKGL
jgi:hypothetical protein